MKVLAIIFVVMTALAGGMFKAVQPEPILLPQKVVYSTNRAARRASGKKGKKKFGY